MSNLFIDIAGYYHLNIFEDNKKDLKIEVPILRYNKKAISYMFYTLPDLGYNFNLKDFLDEWEKRKGLEVLMFHSNLFGLKYNKLKENIKENEFRILAVLDILYDRCMYKGSIDSYLTSIGLNGEVK